MATKYIRPDTNEMIRNALKKIVIEHDEMLKECDLIDLLIKLGLANLTKKDIENLIDQVDE